VDSLLDLQDGVITMAQALRHMSRKAVRHRLATGRWQRPHRSVFVTHSGPIGTTQRRWIAVLSIGEHAMLGGITAAQAGRRRLITQTALDAAGGTHSLAEIDFVELCHRHDLPEPSLQVVRHDAAGRRRYLDALFEPWQVHVEIDGGQHLDARQAWSGMRRQNELWIAGDRVLRFPAWALRHDPGAVMAQVRAALCAAGWQESQ